MAFWTTRSKRRRVESGWENELTPSVYWSSLSPPNRIGGKVGADPRIVADVRPAQIRRTALESPAVKQSGDPLSPSESTKDPKKPSDAFDTTANVACPWPDAPSPAAAKV